MLLDPATLDLAPRSVELLDRFGGDPRFALELPASHLEIVVGPAATVGEAIAALARGRLDLAAGVGGDVLLAGAGLHPFAAEEGELNTGPRYDRTVAEHGRMASRQLVCAVQVHVAIRGAERALRGPRRDALLPARARRAGGQRPVPRRPRHGPGVGAPAGERAAAAAGHPAGAGVVGRARRGAGLDRRSEPLVVGAAPAPAARDPGGPGARHAGDRRRHRRGRRRRPGARGAARGALRRRRDAARARDLAHRGEPPPRLRGRGGGHRCATSGPARSSPARARLHALIDELEPTAERLGCAAELASARRLVERNGAMEQRAAGTRDGRPSGWSPGSSTG